MVSAGTLFCVAEHADPWARQEFVTALLKTHEMRVITCNGGESVPYIIRTKESLNLSVGFGQVPRQSNKGGALIIRVEH